MLNEIHLIGRVISLSNQKNPKVKEVWLRMNTSERFTDRNGNIKEPQTQHEVRFFGKLAEIVENYLADGVLIFVKGKIVTMPQSDSPLLAAYVEGREMKILNRGK